MPHTVSQLLAFSLNRLESDIGRELVATSLSLLACCPVGKFIYWICTTCIYSSLQPRYSLFTCSCSSLPQHCWLYAWKIIIHSLVNSSPAVYSFFGDPDFERLNVVWKCQPWHWNGSYRVVWCLTDLISLFLEIGKVLLNCFLWWSIVWSQAAVHVIWRKRWFLPCDYIELWSFLV